LDTIFLDNALFYGGYHALLSPNREIIADSISTETDPEMFLSAFLSIKKVESIAGVCSTFRSHRNSYYHTLVDNLPRLFLLASNQRQNLAEIQLLCASPLSQVENFFLNKLQPDNCKIVFVEPDKFYQTERFVFLPFLTRKFSAGLPRIYLDYFRDRILPKRPSRRNQRIYIARIETEKGKQRCVENEEKLLAAIEPYGFQRYVLDDMSIEEQIELFYDAESVISPHGAGLTNLLFSDRVWVMELFPTPHVIPHYYYLCKTLGHRYQYWCAGETARNSNFSVDVSAIVDAVVSADKTSKSI
jgi:capsular polysaccharide biosynthesis protein